MYAMMWIWCDCDKDDDEPSDSDPIRLYDPSTDNT